MSGAVPPFPCMPSWCGQRKLYLYVMRMLENDGSEKYTEY